MTKTVAPFFPKLIQICLLGAVACLNSRRRAAEPMPIFRPPRKINQGHQFMNTSFLQTFRAPLLLLLCALWMPWNASAVGYWTQLANPAPGGVGVNVMLLLPDGTVMAAENDDYYLTAGVDWFRLTPDNLGSYANGTWSIRNSMNYSRLFYTSLVMTNGNVLVAGGEYGTGKATAELYDLVSKQWSVINPPASLLVSNKYEGFADSESMMLPDGTVLIHPAEPANNNGTLIYNPSANNWSLGPTTVQYLGEASFVKLADGSIISIDPISTGTNGVSSNGFGTNSERYLPDQNKWVQHANLPVQMYATLLGFVGETGPGLLLPNGSAFFLGGVGHTAIYTPSGGDASGTWVAGPDIPGGLVDADSPAAMMPNGKILCAVTPPLYFDTNGLEFPGPTSFYEYDYTDHSHGTYGWFTPVTGFTDNYAAFHGAMLMLPDGTVLFSNMGTNLYLYHPDPPTVTLGKPVINNISDNLDGSFTLTGTGLNGISAGAAYGDDLQMDSNYPLIRFTDPSGNVLYGRTFNWNSTGVMTGNNIVSTKFTPPSNLPAGSSFVVVANGIASDSVVFYPSDFPTVNFVSPTNGAVGSDTYAPLILGSADDSGVAISIVRVALNRNSDGAWYDFVSSSWGTTILDLNRDVFNDSGLSGQHTGWLAQLPKMTAGNYTVQAQSVNVHSNASPWLSIAFTIESAPVVTFSPLVNQQVVFNFNQLGGTVSDPSTVQFTIEWFHAGGNQFWNGVNWTSVATDPGVLLPANVSGLNWTPAPTSIRERPRPPVFASRPAVAPDSTLRGLASLPKHPPPGRPALVPVRCCRWRKTRWPGRLLRSPARRGTAFRRGTSEAAPTETRGPGPGYICGSISRAVLPSPTPIAGTRIL